MTRWHPREHRKALDGMLMLTLEERGAYNTCLDLIYDREGPIPDDGRWLSGWMGVSLRKWATIRASLVLKGKLFAVNLNGVDCLMNQRAAIELENQSERSRNLAEIGAKGGRKSAETRANPSKNNAEPQASAAPTLKLIDTTSTVTVTDANNAREEPDWVARLWEARAAAADGLDPTSTGVMHAKDLRALVEPLTGEPCEWSEVLDAVRMCAARAKTRGKPIRSWAWVKDDALALRDKRLTAANPEPRQAHERPNPDSKHQRTLANYERAWTGSERAARFRSEP